jgi:hypothetical protein
LLFDTVCDPALLTSLFHDPLTNEDVTQFVFTDVPGADEFEVEFIDPDTSLVSARSSLVEPSPQAANSRFCPATADQQAIWTEVPPLATFSYRWSDDYERAANQFAINYRNGFRYAIFRVRAIDTVHNRVGPYSREGLMVSCIDQSVCTFDLMNELTVPHIDVPVPNVPPLMEETCDDVKYVQIAKGVLPPSACVAW